ncbi:MAG TPA: MarC family protein, partial [Candidatus Omnitrophota bacterium]|nr:MarC family protein [Candidatus Omnitrophota bacterium]
GLTEGESAAERRKTFSTALLTGAVLLAVFAFAGSLIFDLFALTIDDVRIAGGILLLFVAVEIMIRGRINIEHKEDLGVVPLGSPLLVGPGAITSTLVMMRLYNFWAVIAGIVACFFVIWLVLHFAENIYNFLGRNGALIITKIAAIVIAAIAVQFIKQGILAIFVH